MNKFVICFAILCLLCSCGAPLENPENVSEEESVLDYVDPNIGTAHSRWFFYTPGAVPFGLAKLGPSTNGSYGNESGWEAVGYDSRHNSIEGFANLHEFQIGGFLFTATTGELQTVPGTLENPDEGYRSRFDKKDEVAAPGYYKVKLKDYDVTTELTATKRVGFQKYTFPESDSSHIILDIGNQLGESGKVKDASVTYNDDNTIEGWVTTYPEYVKKYQPEGEVSMYFYGEVSKTPKAVGTFTGEEKFKDQKSITGKGAGLFLDFDTEANESIEIKAGFSYTSIENARLNFKTEAENLEFKEARSAAQSVCRTE